MSQFDIFILPDSEAEIEAAFLWYRERNPEAAAVAACQAEAFDGIDALGNEAMQWKMDEDGTRRCLLRHFPYTVFYEIDGMNAFVLAVAHRRREPGYWRQR